MVLALAAGGISLFYNGQMQALLRDAERQRDIARQQRGIADAERQKAEKAETEANRQRARADGLLYVNRLALAQHEIEQNEFCAGCRRPRRLPPDVPRLRMAVSPPSHALAAFPQGAHGRGLERHL